MSNIRSCFNQTMSEFGSPPSTTTRTQSFVFGSQGATYLTFSSLRGIVSSTFQSSTNQAFAGSGSKLFGEENIFIKNKSYEDDPEREVNGLDFKPIVQLKMIEQSSGEESEDVIYCQRAKLFRYDKNTSQWKERGVGNIKILQHKLTRQFRVLMRREKTLKICANHILTSEMKLIENTSSDRSMVWHTNADISDGEAKSEQLAVRFKNAQMAKEFNDMFDECKEQMKLFKIQTSGIEKKCTEKRY